jgi:hypothetical protein
MLVGGKQMSKSKTTAKKTTAKDNNIVASLDKTKK